MGWFKKDPYKGMDPAIKSLCKMLDEHPMEWVEVKTKYQEATFQSRKLGVEFTLEFGVYDNSKKVQIKKPFRLTSGHQSHAVVWAAVQRAFAYQIEQMDLANLTPVELAKMKCNGEI